MEKLQNEYLTVEVSDLGAELQSIKDADDKEYLWQGDDKYWGRRSPILFPIVCGLWKGTYRTEGETYQLGRHGFARDMNFKILRQTDHSVTYCTRPRTRYASIPIASCFQSPTSWLTMRYT